MTLNTYFVKAIPKAAAKESSPAITQTKVYRKVSRAWEDKVDKLFLSHRYASKYSSPISTVLSFDQRRWARIKKGEIL